MIFGRVETQLETHQPEEQHGFRIPLGISPPLVHIFYSTPCEIDPGDPL